MNCRRAKKLVFEFIDGLAGESSRAELEKHLSGCPECEKLASQLTRSMDLVHRAPVETLDDNFNWKVRLAIHKERNVMQESMASQGALFKAWNLRYAASAAAGLVMVMAVGWMALGTGMVSWERGSATSGPVATVPSETIVATPSAQEQNTMQMTESPFTRQPAAQPVSEGGLHGPVRRVTGRQGAITLADSGVNLDSLIGVEMADKSEAERVQYLQERIELLNQHLDRCNREKQE